MASIVQSDMDGCFKLSFVFLLVAASWVHTHGVPNIYIVRTLIIAPKTSSIPVLVLLMGC